MMNYELFKEVITEKFMDFMPEAYQDYKMDVHSVNRVNQTLDAITLVSKDANDKDVTPTIYMIAVATLSA